MDIHDLTQTPLLPREISSPAIPAGLYGALVGKVNGPLSDADNNHVFIPINVASGTGAGVWKIAFNVESNSPPKVAQYYILDETVRDADFPAPGFLAQAQLSYTALGLKAENFKLVANSALRMLVHSSVINAQIVKAYGFTFPGGGMHDIHYNNGESAGSGHANHPGKDGALSIYYHESTGQAVRRWIFIKFQTQSL